MEFATEFGRESPLSVLIWAQFGDGGRLVWGSRGVEWYTVQRFKEYGSCILGGVFGLILYVLIIP